MKTPLFPPPLTHMIITCSFLTLVFTWSLILTSCRWDQVSSTVSFTFLLYRSSKHRLSTSMGKRSLLSLSSLRTRIRKRPEPCVLPAYSAVRDTRRYE
ncbi:hypothetical protein PM082_023403 [Marasmius tenuissimus]|nr:hypothetical protein PM082_023403 [Marasmius tenuissimus]